MANNKNYQELLLSKFAGSVTINEIEDSKVYVDKKNLYEVMEFLQENDLTFLADISSADYKEYFEVAYQLYSFDSSDHLSVKVKLEHDKPEVDSVFKLWSTADWMEREVYDLMGIKFLNHPNLERILTWEGFDGHPLRKDYVSKSGRK
ncbi:MAG: NADH-quinone oxidoreductase subunit C [Bacillota bacterium]